MKKILFLLLPLMALAQNPLNPPYGIKNNAATSDSSPAFFITSQTDNVYKKTPAALIAKTSDLDKKQFLSTGLIKNGLISINADPTKYDISAGIGVITNYDNPEVPTCTVVSFSATTAKTPTYLLTGNITYVAINSSGVVVEQATEFTPVQRRDLIILGAVVHSNLTNINVVNNISAPTNADTNQLHDFMEAIGPLNLTGNKYTANGANLSLDKTAGTIFKFGVNFANDWKNPHELSQGAGTALTFRYRTQNGTEGADVTSINPALYDLSNVLTVVPNNKFTIQTVTMFQTGLTRIQYGQILYNDLDSAVRAILTRDFVVENNIKMNGITRAYIIVRNSTTSLQNTVDAKIVEAQKFGGVASGGVALTDAAIIAALGYTPANDIDVVHKTGNETIAGVKTFTNYFTADNFKVTEANTRAIVGTSILANNTGSNLAGIGYGVLLDNTIGYDIAAVGTLAARKNTTGGGIVAVGNESVFSNQTSFYLTGVGDATLKFATAPESTALGAYAGHLLTTGFGCLFLGNSAGRNQTTESNTLIIDNQNRTSAVLEQEKSLIFGKFNSDSSLQKLRFNARVGINEDVQDTFALSVSGAINTTVSLDAPRLNMINNSWGMQYFSNFGDRSDYTRFNSFVGFQWWKTNGNVELAYLDETGKFTSNTLVATNYTGSATLTGTPTAPTATVGTDTDQIATTAFVNAQSAIVPIDEGNGIGYVIKGRTAANYGNIGNGATDLSYSGSASSTIGATGTYSFASGESNTASQTRSGIFGGGLNNASSDNAVIVGGYGNTNSGSSAGMLGGTYSFASGESSATVGGSAIVARSKNEVTIGAYNTSYTVTNTNTDRAFGIGNGVFASPSDALIVLKNGTVINSNVVRLKNYTVATLPTGVQGDTAYVTDATAPTYLGALTGGGAVVCPVFFDGSVWRSH